MNPVTRVLARVRAMDPMRFDVGLAAFGCFAIVVESTFIPDWGHSRVLTAILGVIAVAPVAWRRTHTLAVCVFFGVFITAQSFLDSFLMMSGTTPFIAALVLLYTAGRHAAGWSTWASALAVGAGVYATLFIDPAPDQTGSAIWGVILLLPPVLAGRAMRNRVLLQRELREKAERLEAEREQHAIEAVESERDRIAGELQAVVANSVSAIVLQAEGVPRVLESGDTGRAAEALERIEDEGREALAEMRRLLGVLRKGEGERPALAPQPSLARAAALVARASDGVPVALSVEGDPVALPPGVDLAAYRVLQEALASATGAGGVSRVDVDIRYGPRDVTVSVSDDRAAGEPDPSALAAMRERVGLYDGSLRTEPARDGRGYCVIARLPRAEVYA